MKRRKSPPERLATVAGPLMRVLFWLIFTGAWVLLVLELRGPKDARLSYGVAFSHAEAVMRLGDELFQAHAYSEAIENYVRAEAVLDSVKPHLDQMVDPDSCKRRYSTDYGELSVRMKLAAIGDVAAHTAAIKSADRGGAP